MGQQHSQQNSQKNLNADQGKDEKPEKKMCAEVRALSSVEPMAVILQRQVVNEVAQEVFSEAKVLQEVSLSVRWYELDQLEAQMKSALRNVLLGQCKNLTITVGCTSKGLYLRLRSNCDDDGATPVKTCSSTSKIGSFLTNNYMNAVDVFLLPKVTYADKSTQVDNSKNTGAGEVLKSTVTSHPYRLKPNREVSSIEVKSEIDSDTTSNRKK